MPLWSRLLAADLLVRAPRRQRSHTSDPPGDTLGASCQPRATRRGGDAGGGNPSPPGRPGGGEDRGSATGKAGRAHLGDSENGSAQAPGGAWRGPPAGKCAGG